MCLRVSIQTYIAKLPEPFMYLTDPHPPQQTGNICSWLCLTPAHNAYLERNGDIGETIWLGRGCGEWGAAQVPNGTVGTRAAPHKTFQRATFQIGALSSIFYPIDKVFGVWLDFVLQVKCQKGRVHFLSLRKCPPLKMERKNMTFAITRRTPHPQMALFSGHLLTLFLSFAIESFMYETDFTLGPNKEYY